MQGMPARQWNTTSGGLKKTRPGVDDAKSVLLMPVSLPCLERGRLLQKNTFLYSLQTIRVVCMYVCALIGRSCPSPYWMVAVCNVLIRENNTNETTHLSVRRYIYWLTLGSGKDRVELARYRQASMMRVMYSISILLSWVSGVAYPWMFHACFAHQVQMHGYVTPLRLQVMTGIAVHPLEAGPSIGQRTKWYPLSFKPRRL